MKKNTIRILQLSDLHFGSSHETGLDTKPEAEFLVDSVKHSPVDSLLNGIASFDPLPDLVIMTGDFVTGKDQIKDYTQTKDILHKLASNNSKYLNRNNFDADIIDRILLVPGNHDVERDSHDPLQHFKKAFEDYLTPYTTPDSKNNIRKHAPLYVFEKQKLVIYCLSTVEMANIANPKTKDLIKYIESKVEEGQEREETLKYLKSILYPDAYGVSEDIYSKFNEKNEEFVNSNKDHKQYTKILLSHHPFIFSDYDTTELRSFNNLINGGKFYKLVGDFGYKVICHGHTHTPRMLLLGDILLKNNSIIHIGTPSLGSNSDINGIATSDIRTDSTGVKLQTSFRNYVSHLRKFDSKETSFDVMISSTEQKFSNIKGQKILIDTELRQLISKNNIIINGNIDRVEPTHYDCALGSAAKEDDEGITTDLLADSELLNITIQPNEMIFVETLEEFNIPKNMIFHVSPLSRWMKKGLIANISFFADAGFKGKFKFPVVNITSKPVEIAVNKPIISVEVTVLKNEVEKGWYERRAK